MRYNSITKLSNQPVVYLTALAGLDDKETRPTAQTHTVAVAEFAIAGQSDMNAMYLTAPINIHIELFKLESEIRLLNQRIEELKTEIHELKLQSSECETIEIRDITKEQARIELKEWVLRQKGKWYYSDAAEELKIDVETVFDLCNEFIQEGIVEIG